MKEIESPHDPEVGMNRRISRRKFGAISGAILVGGVGTGIKFGSEFHEQNSVWDSAGVDNDTFLAQNEELFGRIQFGASFAPEQFGLELFPNEKTIKYEKRQELAENALKWMIDDIGIKDIRLGVRETNSILTNGDFTFDFYKPFFDICMERNARITLNSGLKIFRYPEVHLPDETLDKLPSIPPIGATINAGDPLAQIAKEDLGDLLSTIVELYPDKLHNIIAFQPENESFVEGAGDKKWVISKNHVKDMVKKARPYLPHADILLNSSESENLSEIRQVFTELVEEDEELQGKCIAGIDYYYNKPGSWKPFFVKTPVEPVTASKLRNIWGLDGFTSHKKAARMMDIRTEITEAQAEAWGQVKAPQESEQGFKFMVLRIAPFTDGIIRIWGIEEFARRALENRLTNQNENVLSLVRQIQKKAV